MQPLITVRDVSKSYRKTTALLEVSLDIYPAEIFCVIGPDGAGKSSLMHILAGVLEPDEGEVHMAGTDVVAHPELIKNKVGLMAQGLGHTLYPELSVEENINYFAAVRNVPRDERERLKSRLLDATQLTPFTGRTAKNLSGGMKQKLALCCTLIHSPEILLLDEPTTGVDPVSRRDFYRVLQDFMREQGVTIIVNTSSMDEAERSHRMAMMYDGSVITTGKTADLKASVEDLVLELETSEQEHAITLLRDSGRTTDIIQRGRRLTITVPDEDSVDAVTNNLRNGGFQDPARHDVDVEFLFIRSIREQQKDRPQQSVGELVARIGDNGGRQNDIEVIAQADKLTRRFGNFTAVDEVSFTVAAGEVFGFLGPNGAGKTTLIKMLCGLLPPSDGGGMVLDIPLGQSKMAIARQIGYMSQKFSLYGDLKVRENIRLYGGIYGLGNKELREKAEIAIQLADLEGRENDVTKSLPLGLKQRLALCCAILHGPKLLFLDEPTSGVDPLVRDRFWRIIFQLSRRFGMTVIVTTHYMDEAERCDRLMMMLDGRIQAIGTPDDLRDEVEEHIGKPIRINSPDPEMVTDALSGRFKRISRYGSSILAYTPDPDPDLEEIREILSGIPVNSITAEKIPFEDIFIHYAERGDENVV